MTAPVAGRGFDRQITVGVLVTVLIQSAGVLLWAGGAAERIARLEAERAEGRGVTERLARLEEQVAQARGQLDRIERRLPGPERG